MGLTLDHVAAMTAFVFEMSKHILVTRGARTDMHLKEDAFDGNRFDLDDAVRGG